MAETIILASSMILCTGSILTLHILSAIRTDKIVHRLLSENNKLANKCAAKDVNAYHGLAQADVGLDEAYHRYVQKNRLNGNGAQELSPEQIRQAVEQEMTAMSDNMFPGGD